MVTATEDVLSAITDFTAAATRPSTVVTVKALVPEGAGGVATGAIFLREREKERGGERERERQREEGGREGGGVNSYMRLSCTTFELDSTITV